MITTQLSFDNNHANTIVHCSDPRTPLKRYRRSTCFQPLNHSHTAILILHREKIVFSGPLQMKLTTVLLQLGQEAPR